MLKKTIVLVLVIFFSLIPFGMVDAQVGGWSDMMPCTSGEFRPCGTDTGECKRGVRVCEDSQWTDCQNFIGPAEEICGNQKDEDCNRIVDDCADNTLGYLLIGSGAAVLVFALILSKIKVAPKEDY